MIMYVGKKKGYQVLEQYIELFEKIFWEKVMNNFTKVYNEEKVSILGTVTFIKKNGLFSRLIPII